MSSEISADDSQTNLTGTNVVMGTHLYMSPEQLRGARDVTVRTDIWALGVCLYQLTTGLLPFEPVRPLKGRRRRQHVDTLMEISALILTGTPRAPHEVVPEIPPGLSKVILRCLEKEPERRFLSVADLANDLESFASREFKGIGLRLENVLEGETIARELQPTPAQSAPDTIRDSADARTTDKMERAAPRRALDVAEAVMRNAYAPIRRTLERVDARRRSMISGLARERRTAHAVAITAFAATSIVVFIVVMFNQCAKRAATTAAPAEQPDATEANPTRARAAPSSRASELPTQPSASSTVSSAASAGAASARTADPPSANPPADSTAARTPDAPPPTTNNAKETPTPSARGSSVPDTPTRPPSTPTASAAPGRKSNCDPPWVKNADGDIRWKPECIF